MLHARDARHERKRERREREKKPPTTREKLYISIIIRNNEHWINFASIVFFSVYLSLYPISLQHLLNHIHFVSSIPSHHISARIGFSFTICSEFFFPLHPGLRTTFEYQFIFQIRFRPLTSQCNDLAHQNHGSNEKLMVTYSKYSIISQIE